MERGYLYADFRIGYDVKLDSYGSGSATEVILTPYHRLTYSGDLSEADVVDWDMSKGAYVAIAGLLNKLIPGGAFLTLYVDKVLENIV